MSKSYKQLDQEFSKAWSAAPAPLKEKMRLRNRYRLAKDWDKVLAVESEITKGPYRKEFSRLEDLDFERRYAYEKEK